jgi:hypothetical protein
LAQAVPELQDLLAPAALVLILQRLVIPHLAVAVAVHTLHRLLAEHRVAAAEQAATAAPAVLQVLVQHRDLPAVTPFCMLTVLHVVVVVVVAQDLQDQMPLVVLVVMVATEKQLQHLQHLALAEYLAAAEPAAAVLLPELLDQAEAALEEQAVALEEMQQQILDQVVVAHRQVAPILMTEPAVPVGQE